MSRDMDKGVRAVDVGTVRALYDLLGRDREALADLVDAFDDETPVSLAALRRGAAQHDARLAGRAAHSLKSNGSTFGAGELVALCRQLEVAARAHELAASVQLIDRVDVELSIVSRELAALRDGEGL
jgi:HPt (histidine-containing phosphotransfer) domain-containing protein